MAKNSQNIILLTVLLFSVFTLRQLFISAPDVDPTHEFNTARAYDRLVRILGDETPHPVDSTANDLVRNRLLTEITSLDFDPIVTDDFSCIFKWRQLSCARVQNIMFWVQPPTGGAGSVQSVFPDTVVFASHYDSTPVSPGASDDGVGIAASLEIAALLKDQPLPRPFLVLITDGEEVGLLGAKAFVENNPIAQRIAAVVNVEARGVRGPAIMFQTSRPNGRDLLALETDVQKPISNSLSADIYDMMPNDTDATIFLTLGADVVNYAYTEGVRFYHSSRDNLAHMDKRSLFHLGASSLSAVRVLLDQDAGQNSRPETQWMYTDILGLGILKAPQALGLPTIILGVAAALVVFLLKGAGAPWRAAAFPPAAIALGVGAAIGVTTMIGAIRPESSFGGAHPWALRGAQDASALFGAIIAFIFIARPILKTAESKMRVLAAGWFWFAILMAGATLAVPGAAILGAPALAIVVVGCAAIFFFSKTISIGLFVIAGIVLAVLTIPMAALGETNLFIENAAPFTIFLILLFTVFAPLVSSANQNDGVSGRWLLGGVGGVLLFFIGAAFVVPAYSFQSPRGLLVTHSMGAEPGSAAWSVRSREPLPKAVADAATFEKGRVDHLPGNRFIAPAPDFESAGITVERTDDSIEGDVRTVTFSISAPDADVVWMRALHNAPQIKTMAINDFETTFDGDKMPTTYCHGRSCRSFTFKMTLPTTHAAFSFAMISQRSGLGPESATLLAARPDHAVPYHWGDIRVVSEEIKIQALGETAGAQ